MATYKVEVIVDTPKGWTKDDVLAAAITAIGETVYLSSVKAVTPNHLSVIVAFRADSDLVAWTLVRAAKRSLPSSSSARVSRKTGRAFSIIREATA